MSIKFGPGGNGALYKLMGMKNTMDVPRLTKEMGLDMYEYECGRGVSITEENARRFGELAKENDITLSLHAPYYVSMSGIEEEKRLNSANYILQSAIAANAMGAKNIVVHSGSCSKISREEALELAKSTFLYSKKILDENGLLNVNICPETMGKINQLGTLQEVMEICKLDESFIPCIDFGHLNARTLGAIKNTKDYIDIIKTIKNELGEYRGSNFHVHFSQIEYTDKGEKKHLTFEDEIYGPDYKLLMEAFVSTNVTPTVVCESAGTQCEDALEMKKYYNNLLNK